MLKEISRGSFKLFLSGHGMSMKTGKHVALAALVGTLVGLVTVAFYCTTALPLIVAVTNIAVSAGAMQQSTASIMVAAGAVTVFLMPLLAMACQRVLKD